MSPDAAWRPRTVTSDELVDPAPVAALAAMFDDDLPTPRPGDPLPPLWHWVALPRWSPSRELGADGHPRRGSFLPPVDLPRRMFAGGRVEYPGVVRVGDTVRRESVVESVTEKRGRSGRLVIVVVATTLYGGDGAPAVRETQNLVYREAAPPGAAADVDPAPAPVGAPLRADGPDRWALRTDPALLMRFSAATANTHRIHYDWPYATRVEGYPGLVVHGPLMTLSLIEALRLRGDVALASVTHRTVAPLFCGESASVTVETRPAGIAARVLGPDGAPRTVLDAVLSGSAESRAPRG
ncbi:FAS1-like dehydratase domain-containing protein [Gordonia shandongensis]|uniref:FAS1-like dehydratase domain-containing protein n=1 Tax=Gordonia shandongensis TaxID=376351 RepID=UPI0003FB72A3|nr:MaoC family dehydratase N-terminal domain-containing protein [Gordonia shandongensis]